MIHLQSHASDSTKILTYYKITVPRHSKPNKVHTLTKLSKFRKRVVEAAAYLCALFDSLTPRYACFNSKKAQKRYDNTQEHP